MRVQRHVEGDAVQRVEDDFGWIFRQAQRFIAPRRWSVDSFSLEVDREQRVGPRGGDETMYDEEARHLEGGHFWIESEG